MKFCSECGCENLDEAIFCKNCGFKFKSLPVTENRQDNPINLVVNENQNSIVSKLFFKRDKDTGPLRFAKSKSISIVVFVFMFLFAISVNLGQFSLAIVISVAIIFGFVFALATLFIGTALGWAIEKLNN